MVVQGTAIATLPVMKSTELQLLSSQGMSHASARPLLQLGEIPPAPIIRCRAGLGCTLSLACPNAQ